VNHVGVRKPTLGYPSRCHAVFALHQQGLGVKAIAERVGIREDNARATLRWAKKNMRPTYASFTLTYEARLRGLSVPELEARLLEIIARDGLVGAILDDRLEAAE
jgi:hypothetical protein